MAANGTAQAGSASLARMCFQVGFETGAGYEALVYAEDGKTFFSVFMDKAEFGSQPEEQWFFHSLSWSASQGRLTLGVNGRIEAVQVPPSLAERISCPGGLGGGLVFDGNPRMVYRTLRIVAQALPEE